MKLIYANFKVAITFVALIYSVNLFSQSPNVAVIDSTVKKESRLKFAFGFGLNFVGATNISLSPSLIYKTNDKISLGFGLQGSYAAIKDLQKTTTFGFNAITTYTPTKKISTLLELVQLNVTTKVEAPVEDKNSYWDTALFVGAGYNITNKFTIGAKYNLLYNEDESVYTSPIVPFVNIVF
jgi:long-subunit fatty acid transport protein